MRKQRFNVAGFDQNMKTLWKKEIEVEAKDVTVCKNVIGSKAPAAILLNYEDFGYGVFHFEEKSLEAFKAGLSKIEDNLTRGIIFSNAFMMAREAKMSPDSYISLIVNHIHTEKSQDILSDAVKFNLPLIAKNYVPHEH